MKGRFAIITGDEFFYFGMESIIKNIDESNQVFRVNLKDINNMMLLKQLVVDSYVFVIYLHTVSENFIILSRLEDLMGRVVLFSNNKRIANFCPLYGINSVDLHSIHEIATILRFPNWVGCLNKSRLSYKEKYVLIKLLNGWSMGGLAKVDGISYKTISTHKINALAKLGIKNINLLVGNENSEVLKVL